MEGAAVGRAPSAGLRAFFVRAGGFAHAAALSLPARGRRARHAPALLLAALRRSRLLPIAAEHVRQAPPRRARRERDGRAARPLSTAARDQSARASRGISALRYRGGFDFRQLAAAPAHDKENDMSGDYSRVRYDHLIDIAVVLMQQGRVHLDSDWY